MCPRSPGRPKAPPAHRCHPALDGDPGESLGISEAGLNGKRVRHLNGEVVRRLNIRTWAGRSFLLAATTREGPSTPPAGQGPSIDGRGPLTARPAGLHQVVHIHNVNDVGMVRGWAYLQRVSPGPILAPPWQTPEPRRNASAGAAPPETSFEMGSFRPRRQTWSRPCQVP